jgi:hypothetical protein
MGNVSDDTDYVIIKEPVQVVQIPPRAANDSGSIAFSPFLDYTNEFRTGIRIHRDDVLATTTPILELENQYNTIFGSGIQIAKTL